jgi:hypothetical protein
MRWGILRHHTFPPGNEHPFNRVSAVSYRNLSKDHLIIELVQTLEYLFRLWTYISQEVAGDETGVFIRYAFLNKFVDHQSYTLWTRQTSFRSIWTYLLSQLDVRMRCLTQYWVFCVIGFPRRQEYVIYGHVLQISVVVDLWKVCYVWSYIAHYRGTKNQ